MTNINQEQEVVIKEEIKNPKKIVKDAFQITREMVNRSGWKGNTLEEGGLLRNYFSPQIGEMTGDYVSEYPRNLEKFVSEVGSVEPKSLALINLAYIWSKAQIEYKDNEVAFKGNLLKEIADDPKFKLAQLLVEPQESGIPWLDVVDSNPNLLDAKFHNGESDRRFNPNFPHLKADKVREIIPEILSDRKTISVSEVLQLMENLSNKDQPF